MNGAPTRLALGSLALAWSPHALACAVCSNGGQNQQAFINMTIFLSLLPLTLLGGLVGVLWYLHRQATAAQPPEANEPQRRGAGGPSSSESPAAM